MSRDLLLAWLIAVTRLRIFFLGQDSQACNSAALKKLDFTKFLSWHNNGVGDLLQLLFMAAKGLLWVLLRDPIRCSGALSVMHVSLQIISSV